MDGPDGHERSGLREYLEVLRRRKWIALQALILVPAAAVVFSLYQTAKYEASAEVLLSRQNFAASLSNVADPNLSVQADRLAQTQADLAQVPPVIQQTLAAAHVTNITVDQFAAASSVTAKTNADLLVFKYTSSDARPGGEARHRVRAPVHRLPHAARHPSADARTGAGAGADLRPRRRAATPSRRCTRASSIATSSWRRCRRS